VNDTPAVVRDRYRRMLLARSGAERLEMGSRMFDAARRLVRASLGDPHGVDDSPELRARLFLRVYGGDFAPTTAARIAARLRGVR
jgi:hypothetical protein